MTKIINPGSITYMNRRSQIFCKIEFNEGKLSITGVIGPRKNGNADGGCGQIDSEFQHRGTQKNCLTLPSEIKFNKEWNEELWLDFLDVWDKWHLNDMSACEHQRKLGWTFSTHRGQNCPECGYLIGSSWFREEVPASMIEFLKNLPESKKTPAWC